MDPVSIGLVSLDLLTDTLKECVLLIGRQEVERAGKCPEQDVRIPVLQISSGQKICANHLQAIAAGLIAAKHQSRRLECLLDDRNLALVQLEIDDLPGLALPTGDRIKTSLSSQCYAAVVLAFISNISASA